MRKKQPVVEMDVYDVNSSMLEPQLGFKRKTMEDNLTNDSPPLKIARI